MAAARMTSRFTEVEEVVKKIKNVDVYVLELSREEAQTLRDVFHRVGGPREGPRGRVDAVDRALALVGIKDPMSFNALVKGSVRLESLEGYDF